MKIGLYLENKAIQNIDLSYPEQGNPGIGGTQFNFVTLPYYFIQEMSNLEIEIEFILYANFTKLLPSQIVSIQVQDVFDAVDQAQKDQCDLFIYRPSSNLESEKKILAKINHLNLKTIAWAHSELPPSLLQDFAECESVKRFVCVGQEQLDRLRDHLIFNKSTCIFNGFDGSNYYPSQPTIKSNNTVVFLGSIIPAKGFHYLAKIWKNVKHRVPNAKLIVIGSGALYNSTTILGQWGIAEEDYEAKYIRPYLSDNHGFLDQSVNFAGLLGQEKIQLLQQANVGVVNPSGRTENCPGSAIEIQAAGTPVVSGAYKGILDTVIHQKTGLLGKKDKDLENNIVYLLDHPEIANQYGKNGITFIQEKFSYQKIIRQWLSLFNDICAGQPNMIQPINQNLFYNKKIIREGFRLLKKHNNLLEKLPSLVEYDDSLKRFIPAVVNTVYQNLWSSRYE